jgi:type IV pilus assembly protein PilA
LVVILIIGILAAIAIPSFLNQKSKAYDASAKEMARTAQTTAETYATDHNGEYTGLEPKVLHEYEVSIPTSEATASGGAYVSAVKVTGGTEFEVTAVAANTKDKFVVIRKSTGVVERECKVGVKGAKTCAGGESSSW